MPQTSPYLPASVEFVDQQMITLVFSQYWYQEDIEELAGLVLAGLGNISSKNTVLGADREDIHFYWRNVCYVLYFESNSQSCWLEAESREDHALLAEMHELLVPVLS
ncbi:hypothetical protein [Thalassomonas haliotis]|uniref:DUF3630 family protein n=1 Tax=Thalassomonas haliotis TaxID=485448 RepID=A0ABY7VEE1_9GAMM|nr:hypothetical protein [Thalassomonas haliotis]WDE11737.1 hypothetical protein H3N35_26680 [Thalassomonas haliotis]